MPLILGTNSIKDTGYDVANSLRFDDGSSDYLDRTPSSTGNRKTWTISVWIKRSAISSVQKFLSFRVDNSNTTEFGYEPTNNELRIYNISSGSVVTDFITSQYFRDVSAWSHFVFACDTTQSTESNRFKIYHNGEQITSFSTSDYPSLNEDMFVNYNSAVNQIGRQKATTYHFDGYMAEVVLIDGTQLDATSFGEFDEDSPTIWKPKDVSGLTFGTNGFHLDFENSGSLGADVSGNGNNFTVNNLTSIDQSTDTCTNNFATLNSLVNFNSGVFSEGNLAITFGDDTVSTIGLTRGRWYWEAQRTNSTNEAHFGIGVSNGFYSATSIVSSGDRLYVRGGTSNFNTASNLSILTFGSNSGTPASFGSGDILSFYLDLESSTKNIIIKKK